MENEQLCWLCSCLAVARPGWGTCACRCDVMAMLDQMDLARNAAKKLGSDPGSYDHVIVDLPVQEGCRLMGFGYFCEHLGSMGR